MEISIEQYNKMAERLTELEYKEAEHQWIPCSERLPGEGCEFLCCDERGEIIIGLPYADEEAYTGFSAESETEYIFNCVAWMPLPEPYKESNGWTTVEEMSGWIKEVNE